MQKGEEQYGVAKGYVQSMYLMITNSARFQARDDRSFALAFHLLAGFAAELFFKAFLAAKGYSESVLRDHKIRHDLDALYALCLSEGLSAEKFSFIVHGLTKQHKNFEFRYLKADSEYDLVDLCTLFEAFSVLDREVDNLLKASASRGIKPSGGWSLPPHFGWRLPQSFYVLRPSTVTLNISAFLSKSRRRMK